MSTIDEVKQKTDIVEVIGQYTKLTKAGRTFRALCPFHSEKNPSFFVYPERQTWHCFGACSTGGDVISFIMKKQSIEFGEALRLLADRCGVTLPSKVEADTQKELKERLFQANEAAAQYFHNLLLKSSAAEKARAYLASRGLNPKTISDFQLGYSLNSWEALKQYLLDRSYTESELLEAGLLVPPAEGREDGKTHDRWRHRLIFPIKDVRGRTTGFGARVLDDSLPKYINSPQTPIFDKSGTLYGLNLAAPAIRQQDAAVIVEGYMDVLTAHQNDFNNVVASMGTAITDKQVNALKRFSHNLALALDADSAGEEAMLRCVEYENTLEAEIRVIILPAGKDPDDVIKDDAQSWQQLVAQAVPVIDYTFDMVTAKLDLTTARDKSLAADRLLPIVAQIKDVVRRTHYLQKLSRLVKVSERSLEAALKKDIPGPAKRPSAQKEPAVKSARHSLVASPVEEYCLALLLQHPQLRDHILPVREGLLLDYFENSENREIFDAWRDTADLALLREKVDSAIWEHLDSLVSKHIPATQIEQKYANCVLRLREKFLRSLEKKREAILTLEAETGGTSAELAKLQEQGTEISAELKEVFTLRAKRSQSARGGRG